MNGTIKINNYLKGIEKLPLTYQLEAINKQVSHFEAVSKNKDLTPIGKLCLAEAWLRVEALRSEVLVKIIAIKSTFSLN